MAWLESSPSDGEKGVVWEKHFPGKKVIGGTFHRAKKPGEVPGDRACVLNFIIQAGLVIAQSGFFKRTKDNISHLWNFNE